MRSKVTMKDVAEVLGVSVMTVSNAFNRPDQLSGDLRERILSRAGKMGYAGPNATARQLRAGQTHCFGVVFSQSLSYAFHDPFSVLWLAGFSEALQRAGATMVLLPTQNAGGVDFDVIRRASIDGLAALCATDQALEVARRSGLHVVDTNDQNPASSWVAIDDHGAGTGLGRHVRQLGHTDVTVLVGGHQTDGRPFPDTPVTIDDLPRGGLYDTSSRVRGFLAGLGDGCRVRMIVGGANSREAGRLAGGLAVDRQDRPTAIVCSGDILAFGVMDALADRGLTPGRDITVTGFDDLPEAARMGLTTVRQPITERGRLTGELLLDPDRTPRQILVPTQLVVRSSSAPRNNP